MVALANNLNSKPGSIGGRSITTPIARPNTDQSRNYNLDALGNWTSNMYTPKGAGSAITDQRNHNKLNEITQRTLTGSSPVVFQYDGATGGSNGNLKNDGVISVSYDAFNRPIQINRVSDGLVIATYLYDAMNRRVRKTISNGGLTGNVPNGTTDYIWSGWQVVEERNSTNAPIRQYVWGMYIDELIQLTTLATLGPQSLPAGTYYLLQDLLYRAVALTDSNGNIVEAYDVDAYGNTLIFTAPGADGVSFTDDDVQSSYGASESIFCGYRYDPETELYYVRNRTYSPPLGRWIQRDPIGYAGGMNLYGYVGGRAGSSSDPYGRQPAIIIGAGVGFLAACAISAIGGWFSGKSACQITRDCVCNGLGGAIAGGTLAGFPSIAGGCVGSALGGVASLVCQSMWHCAGDPPGRSPLGDPCDLIKAGLATAVGCLAGFAADIGEPVDDLNKKLMGLLGSVFGLDCKEAEKCLH